MKVICAGLSKTGTKSLAKALRMRGFTVFDFPEHKKVHLHEWLDVYCQGKEPDFVSVYRNVDAVTDIPSAYWFQEIYETFPDAKVVLSVRDSEEVWVKSWGEQLEIIQTLGGVFNRILIRYPNRIKQWLFGKRVPIAFLEAIINGTFGSLNTQSTFLFKKKYREHNERVQAIIPKEKLLIYNVKQGWKPLCEFLGCEIPEEEFPRANVGLSLTKDLVSARLKSIQRNVIVFSLVLALLATVFYVVYHW